MAGKGIKMDRAARAKQFMPFDALKGFREALEEKERIKVAKRELSEEEKEALDKILNTIRKKDIILVEYFQEGEYTEKTGMVSGIDTMTRMLEVVHTRIPFDDITRLEVKPEEIRERQQ